jgi:hypothetical protein
LWERLLGESNWAALFMLPFSSSEPVISYEFSIMIERQGNDIPDRPGFFDPDASQWGTTFAPVRFDHSAREISFEGQVVGTWTAGTWYRVRVVVDRSLGNGTASMWLDGTLQVQDAQLPITAVFPSIMTTYASVWCRSSPAELRSAPSPVLNRSPKFRS